MSGASAEEAHITSPQTTPSLMLSISYAAAQQLSPAMPALPRALQGQLSPLTRQQELYYCKLFERVGVQAMNESSLDEFCKSGRLLCGASLLESRWGRAIGAKTTSLAFEGRIDKSLFKKGMKGRRSSTSTSQTGTGEMEFVVPSRTGSTATEPNGLQHRSTSTYFQEKDLLVGAQLVLPHFLYQATSSNIMANAKLKPSFLPASIADLFHPLFNALHLKDLLRLFHIHLHMHMALKMRETLEACEGQQRGKYRSLITSVCATSMEAMQKFASSMLSAPSNKIQALTNSKVVGRAGEKVTIVRIAEMAAGQEAVDCQELIFPFKVMGCHRMKEWRAMAVRVRVADEEEEEGMDLLLACHKNTTHFNQQHEAFSQLRSSPGHTELCHFLPNTDIIWIPL